MTRSQNRSTGLARTRKARFEMLEDRSLLSVPPGAVDVELLSATTEDSQSVTFRYVVEGTIDELEFAVYRSEDLTVGEGDFLTGLTLSGTDVTAGLHDDGTIDVALPVDPARPYVFVVADPGNLIAEIDEGNNEAFFRKYTIGVVTHGYSLFGDLPGIGGPPSWIFDVAGALDASGYDAVIPFDWSGMSMVAQPGQTVAAGMLLADAVIAEANRLSGETGFSEFDVIDLHLIGHSRGAVVINEAVRELGSRCLVPDALDHGYVKMTMLDPHPSNASFPHSVNSLLAASPPLNRLISLILKGVEQVRLQHSDPNIVLPENADSTEVYFQNRPAAMTGFPFTPNWPCESPDYTVLYLAEFVVNFWGVNVPGATNIDITWDGGGVFHKYMSHTYVPQWYLDTGLAAADRAPAAVPMIASRMSRMAAEKVDLVVSHLAAQHGATRSMLCRFDTGHHRGMSRLGVPRRLAPDWYFYLLGASV